MNIQFPLNPENGMVFEASSGVFYQYNGPSNTWAKLEGFENISPATMSEPGLMTSSDFKKVEGLLLPPLTTTIAAQECGTTFKDGKLDIISSQEHLNVDVKLDLFKGNKSETKVDFIIHENTSGIDFRINLQRLLDELTARGKLAYKASPGDVGDTGDRGEPGINNLETGPQGITGTDGKNAPYAGVLAEDFNTVKVTGSRAIVDIKNDEANPTSLIITVGNINNPNACPNRANIIDKNSPWVLVTSDKAPILCPVSVPCRICDTNLYYLNTSDILSDIEARYEYLINNVKESKEALVNQWLSKLIELFNEQKQALCCAIEALASKQKNQDIRNTLSTGRAAAAGAGYAFSVSSAPKDTDTTVPRSKPQCTPESIYPPPRSTDPSGDIIYNGGPGFGCETCYVQATLRSGNVGESRALTFDLPAGSYVSTIMQCCLNYDGHGSTGLYSVKFNGDVNNIPTPLTYKTVDRGVVSGETADQLYVGDSITFTHSGGPVSVWADSFISSGIDGEIVLCVQPTSCFANCITPSIAAANIIDPTCSMAASHLEFYERGWIIGECCGAYINVHGTGFLVVLRSIGVDMACGGGESLTTPCIAKFKDLIGKQVAVAWPTTDGKTFFGLPRDLTSMVDMVYDKSLSQAIVDAISANSIFKKVGMPEKSITDVIVPIVL